MAASDDDPVAPAETPFRLLFVCTANRCRSPMAESLARAMLDQREVDAEVGSCGLLESGAPVSLGSVRAVARHGVDLRGHLSRQMDAQMLREADLIVAMERRHLLAVAELDLDAVNRSFTLVELAELAIRVGPRPREQSTREWIAAANRHRLASSVLAAGTADDVDDPMGQSRRAYRRTAAQIDDLLHDVVDRLFAAGRST